MDQKKPQLKITDEDLHYKIMDEDKNVRRLYRIKRYFTETNITYKENKINSRTK